ncbi:biopolymer transporter ExbD [Akkermansiaceae bacterium]|nr:biopolymer transporter ExbD [Akkermansiaceae bacterium]
MKLKMSLPEHPGLLFAIPGFDFVALLLALVMLTGVVAKEGLVEVKLPRSGFRSKAMSEENPVIVTVQSTVNGPAYYVGRNQVSKGDLENEISTLAEERETRVVAIKVDQGVSVSDFQEIKEMIFGLDLGVLEVVRSEPQLVEGEE